MNHKEFAEVFEMQIQRMTKVLLLKADEYATDDRLHNFKVAGEMQGVPARQALAGMMAKHSISLYDMMHAGAEFPMARWHEKITDHMNYLVLLLAIVTEDSQTDDPQDTTKGEE